MRLKSLRKQQFSSNGLVTVPPALARNLAQQAVQRLGVRIGNRMQNETKITKTLLFGRASFGNERGI